MVNSSDNDSIQSVHSDSQTLLATAHKAPQQRRSYGRWFKHMLSFQSSKRLISRAQAEQITAAIAQAEHGHRGEIQVVIEGHLPMEVALNLDCRARAEQLFAHYGVWDTEYNSGVLIYLNLCERQIELVADRGIDAAVDEATWQGICSEMLGFFARRQFAEGIIHGVNALGAVMQQYFALQQHQPTDRGNELANRPYLL